MSRYKPKGTIYKLMFTDPSYDGLEVRAKSVSIGELMEIAGLKDTLDPENPDVEAVGIIFTSFANALVEWNLDKEVTVTAEDGSTPIATIDEPVPPTLAGIYSQDVPFMLGIITAWIDTIANVPAFLEKKSNAGNPFLVGSLRMEDL